MHHNQADKPLPVVAGRYRHDWALFIDWCAAADRPSLPATPEVLASFLHEHPAAAATQRRRVSAINSVHRDHGLLPPGRSDIVRRRLDTARAARLDRLAAALRQRALKLPTTGWPAGLFGRRDALLLILAATGMSFTQISRLCRGNLTTDADDGALIARVDGEQFRLAPLVDEHAHITPAAIFRRWADVLAYLDRRPNTRMLATYLADPQEISTVPLSEAQSVQPLLPPIDRWGHLPLPLQAMATQSVASLTHAHLAGRPPVHRWLPLYSSAAPNLDSVPPEWDSAELDPDYYERGIQARRRSHEALSDIADILDDVEDRADQILRELLAVLDGP
ncbi:hypothetical protein LRS58_19045 [Rhodococcus sp. BH2-1]|nr:hypothetical protein [Rhodococcus sp. BH2-1]